MTTLDLARIPSTVAFLLLLCLVVWRRTRKR